MAHLAIAVLLEGGKPKNAIWKGLVVNLSAAPSVS